MIAAAAIPRKIFLLAPLDSPGALVSPNVNVGADPTKLEDSLWDRSSFFAGTAVSVGRSVDTSATRGSCRSRAGAGALAVPPPNVAGVEFDIVLTLGSA